MPPGTALDAACGTGRHTERLVALGHRTVGLDNSPDMLDRARTRVPQARFQRGRLDRLPFREASFDIIVCGLALPHVRDLQPVFAEFARVLRPGGHLVTTDVHHELVALGSVPHVRSAHGEPGLIATYRHRAGDYLHAALPVGLDVRRCEEPRHPGGDDAAMAAEIETGPWDLWPWSLHDIVPAAAGAVWKGMPALVIWHFQRV